MFKNLSILVKQSIGFVSILLLLFLTGIISYLGINVIGDKQAIIYKAGFQVQNVMMMSLSVTEDLRILMEILESETVNDADNFWKKHQEQMLRFDSQIDTILKGSERDGENTEFTKNSELVKLVKSADEYHNSKLQPLMKDMYSLVVKDIDNQKKLLVYMRLMESEYDEVVKLSEDFEGEVKRIINKRIIAGASARSILEKENTWADMAMELKTTIGNSRIAVEEYAQGFESASLPEIEKKYKVSVAEFKNWIHALQNGADTKEGKIAPITESELEAMVSMIQERHDDRFMTNIDKFMMLQREIVTISEQKLSYEKQADSIGKIMTEIIGKVNELTTQDMQSANDEANKAAKNANLYLMITILLSIILSIILTIVITRAVTKPIKQVLSFATLMSQGDFSQTLDINQKDEIGNLADSLNHTVGNLSRMIRDIDNSVSTLSATSSELSNVAEVMSVGSESTADKANTVAAASEEMNSNVGSVAAAMEESSTNVNNIASAIEEMNINFNEITDRVKQTKENTNHAANVSAKSSDQVSELGQAADEIGTITETIFTIADKTALLALNATIEAARAGDAGKGFAVVASEIKQLAQQASDSTSDIGNKLKAIQQMTKATTKGIKDITDVISQVDESVDSINISMQQQNDATREISENINQTSVGIREINENVNQTSQAVAQITTEISLVNQSANDISSSSLQVEESSEKLTELASQLGQKVSEFKASSKGFASGPVKLSHAAWKKKLADLLSGRHTLEESDISSHKECEFGHWYFGKGQEKFGEIDTFHMIDNEHKKVHDTAKEITRLYNTGKVDEAATLFREFSGITKGLFALLDHLEEETN